jgi:hypothetical protein
MAGRAAGAPGPGALWGLVANGCAAALLEEAHAAGLPAARARRLVGGVLGPPGRPLPVPALLTVGPGDRPRLVRRRVTCCLSYTTLGQPCATCPLLPPSETGGGSATACRVSRPRRPGG